MIAVTAGWLWCSGSDSSFASVWIGSLIRSQALKPEPGLMPRRVWRGTRAVWAIIAALSKNKPLGMKGGPPRGKPTGDYFEKERGA